MLHRLAAATALVCFLSATAASADQFVVRTDGPLPQPQSGLQHSIKIRNVDAFSHDGADYVVVEAPSEGHLKAYFFAIGRVPDALFTVNSNWAAPGLSSLALDQRLPFLSPEPCDFCASR